MSDQEKYRVESLEEYLARQGRITRLDTPEYTQSKTSRFKRKDLVDPILQMRREAKTLIYRRKNQ